MLESYLGFLELAYYEATFAFDSLEDHNVWRRPAEHLLSIGELAGHIAYWQAIKFAGSNGELDPAKCNVTSPLVDSRFQYYTTSLEITPAQLHLEMGAESVCSELLRVHNESVAHLRTRNVDLSSNVPGWPKEATYDWFLKYATFHASYHIGQMYSVRHLLGEVPPDN
jgi:hypothetical protein